MKSFDIAINPKLIDDEKSIAKMTLLPISALFLSSPFAARYDARGSITVPSAVINDVGIEITFSDNS